MPDGCKASTNTLQTLAGGAHKVLLAVGLAELRAREFGVALIIHICVYTYNDNNTYINK